MDTEFYKQLLLAKERELLSDLGTEGNDARGVDGGAVHDTSDEGVDDDIKSNLFTETTREWKVLEQVQDALGRIEAGTFGKCEKDGKPIDEKRLKVIPWARYCLEHEEKLEVNDPAPSTL